MPVGGSAAYHPALLLSLLIYGYATGCYSSRKIERATDDSLAFRYIACHRHPDHDTLAHFRRRFAREFEAVFVQVLQVARENQISRFGAVSLDGTKIHANASRHSALSHEHAGIIEARLEGGGPGTAGLGRAGRWRQHPDGMRVPDELKRREDRLAAIAEAKPNRGTGGRGFAREQADYQAKLAARRGEGCRQWQEAARQGTKPPELGPRPKDQINLTDEESRIMPVAGGGFEQCYNGKPWSIPKPCWSWCPR